MSVGAKHIEQHTLPLIRGEIQGHVEVYCVFSEFYSDGFVETTVYDNIYATVGLRVLYRQKYL